MCNGFFFITQSNHLFESKSTNNSWPLLSQQYAPMSHPHNCPQWFYCCCVIMWYEPVSSRHWYLFYWMKSPIMHQLSTRNKCCHILMRSYHIWKKSRLFSSAVGFSGNFSQRSFKALVCTHTHLSVSGPAHQDVCFYLLSATPQDGWCWSLLHPQQQEWGRSNRCRESCH